MLVANTIRRVLGSILIAAAILLEAVEHVHLIWDYVPIGYANKLSDPKVVVITFLTGIVILVLNRPESREEPNTSLTKGGDKTSAPEPNLVLLHCRESNLPAFNLGGLLFAFRNDVLTFKDAARGVIAHISYSGPNGSRAEVNYGMWAENDDYLVIDRSDTRHLIVGVKEGQSWAAIENIAPQTNYQRHEIVPVGALTPGEWILKVTLSAENFKRDYTCKLIIDPGGSIKYSFPK